MHSIGPGHNATTQPQGTDLERKSIFRGRIIELVLETPTLPNGTRPELEIVHHPGGAAAVALDAEERVCLLRQYRHAVGGWVWEIPAGKRDAGEDPQRTAARELEEEAGITARRWQPLGGILSSPGVFTEVVHLYFAQELARVPARAERHEVFEVHWIALADAIDRVMAGDIMDAKTIVGLLKADRLCRE